MMRRNHVPAMLILLVALLLLVRRLNDFVYGCSSNYSDLVISHYPNLLFLKQTLKEYWMVPWWNGHILSGYPFAANPLSGLWYPPGWILLLLPQPFGFNVLVILHLLLAGFGLYQFLVSKQVSPLVALIGAVNLAFMPKLIAHFGAGHVSLVFSFGWTPWLLWAENKYQSNRLNTFYRILRPVILAMIVLADIRWSIFTVLIWISFSFWAGKNNAVGFSSWVKDLILQLVISMLLAAPLLLPLAEYAAHSSRSLMTEKDRLFLSLPPARLLGLFIADFNGGAEYTIYQGGVAFALCAWALAFRPLRQRSGYWFAILAFSLLYSLGENIPGLRELSNMPGFNLIRVPSRAMLVFGLAISVIVAQTIQSFYTQSPIIEPQAWFAPRLLLTALSAFVIFLTLFLYLMTGSAPVGFIWSSIVLFLVMISILLRSKSVLSSFQFLGVSIVLLLFDLGLFDYVQICHRNAQSVLSEREAVASYLGLQPGVFRVYSPSYSIPQQTAMHFGLELADGVDPLQLLDYVHFMQKATGIPNPSYSVTLPPFDTGNPASDNQQYIPDVAELGLLNVRYIASDFDIHESHLVLEMRIGPTRVYRNQLSMDRAWVQDANENIGSGILRKAIVQQRTPNHIRLQATGPGLLVLSEVYYPGWQVYVDGRQASLLRVAEILRGVLLEQGKHRIDFIYRPMWVYFGIGLGAIAWLYLASQLIRHR